MLIITTRLTDVGLFFKEIETAVTVSINQRELCLIKDGLERP